MLVLVLLRQCQHSLVADDADDAPLAEPEHAENAPLAQHAPATAPAETDHAVGRQREESSAAIVLSKPSCVGSFLVIFGSSSHAQPGLVMVARVLMSTKSR